MQERKKTTIHANYDPADGSVQIAVEGDNIGICVLIGLMVRHITDEWGTRIGNRNTAFLKFMNRVLQAATQDDSEIIKVDLAALRKDKEAGHD